MGVEDLFDKVPLLGLRVPHVPAGQTSRLVARPVRCKFCHKGGGTLHRITPKRASPAEYAHEQCQVAAQSVREAQPTRYRGY